LRRSRREARHPSDHRLAAGRAVQASGERGAAPRMTEARRPGSPAIKALRWALLAAGALIVIALGVVAVVVATFDPNDYKPRIVELVKRQTGRTLALDGKIGVTFFPKIGAALGKATLSAPNSTTIFARVDDAHVAVAVWPLLSKRVIVDRVTLK